MKISDYPNWLYKLAQANCAGILQFAQFPLNRPEKWLLNAPKFTICEVAR